MGVGAIQRTVTEGHPFENVIGPGQTSQLIDWGRTVVTSNRLPFQSGSPSLAEIGIQSRPGGPWDTKQYLPFKDVFIINGKAELRDYVGNPVWGTGLNALGVSQTTALFGAKLQDAFSSVGREDPRDQEAIKFGYSLTLPSSVPVSTSSWETGFAAGGFLLYPNKTNTNMTRSVYSK